jgi:hypothetical protein
MAGGQAGAGGWNESTALSFRLILQIDGPAYHRASARQPKNAPVENIELSTIRVHRDQASHAHYSSKSA